MCWFCGKPKTALQLMEDELKRQHQAVKEAYGSSEARERIKEINKVILNAATMELSDRLEKRLKGIEDAIDAISDLYLVGKSDGTKS